MHGYFFDAVSFSLKEKAKLLGDLSQKTGAVQSEKGFRAKAELLKRIVEIIALLEGTKSDSRTPSVGPADNKNDNWEEDNKVLQQIIAKKHPQLMDAELADEVLKIWDRHKADNDRVVVIRAAVDAWADYVVEKTASDI